MLWESCSNKEPPYRTTLEDQTLWTKLLGIDFPVRASVQRILVYTGVEGDDSYADFAITHQDKSLHSTSCKPFRLFWLGLYQGKVLVTRRMDVLEG